MEQFGLGCNPSPPDPRDYPIEELRFKCGVPFYATPQADYMVPLDLLGPVLNQGTGMLFIDIGCVCSTPALPAKRVLRPP